MTIAFLWEIIKKQRKLNPNHDVVKKWLDSHHPRFSHSALLLMSRGPVLYPTITAECTHPPKTPNIDFPLENNVHVHCIMKEIYTHCRKHRRYWKMTRKKINCLTFWCISFWFAFSIQISVIVGLQMYSWDHSPDLI